MSFGLSPEGGTRFGRHDARTPPSRRCTVDPARARRRRQQVGVLLARGDHARLLHLPGGGGRWSSRPALAGAGAALEPDPLVQRRARRRASRDGRTGCRPPGTARTTSADGLDDRRLPAAVLCRPAASPPPAAPSPHAAAARRPARSPAVEQLLREGWELPAGVTLLVGENGSGKSTIVEAVADASPRPAASPPRAASQPSRSSCSTARRPCRPSSSCCVRAGSCPRG